MYYLSILFLLPAAAQLQPRQTATILDYVTKYGAVPWIESVTSGHGLTVITAPLVYLDQNDPYLPSDLQAQLNNTNPELNFTAVTNVPSPLLLSNLDQLNAIANCNVENFDDCPLYLTSKDNVATNPAWLYGVLPDPVTGETVGAKSCAIIVNDHGNGVVDAFYMYFYAFNMGPTVLNQIQDDHVGDWEHNMIRFTNGLPTSVWFSQHDSGQTFTYEALSKNGIRPIVYSAIGSHANYAVPGTHSQNIDTVTVDDFTSRGPLWDPTLSAYYYTYKPVSSLNGTFTPSDSSTPTSWLYFLGRWGDERYPDSDPRQVNFLNLSVSYKYESGPTGPLDKELNRTAACPGIASLCTTLTALPAIGGSSIPATFSRTSSTQMSMQTSTETTSASTSSTTASSTPSKSASSAKAVNQKGFGLVAIGVWLLAVLTQ